MLSTCHDHEMRMSTGFRKVMKPTNVLTYNDGKGIDLADQLTSYNQPARKTSVWYKKIAADLVSISVVNAILIYNELHPQSKLKVLDGHQVILKKLLMVENGNFSSFSSASSLRPTSHKLTKIPKRANGKIQQKRCASCYKRLNESGFTA